MIPRGADGREGLEWRILWMTRSKRARGKGFEVSQDDGTASIEFDLHVWYLVSGRQSLTMA